MNYLIIAVGDSPEGVVPAGDSRADIEIGVADLIIPIDIFLSEEIYILQREELSGVGVPGKLKV